MNYSPPINIGPGSSAIKPPFVYDSWTAQNVALNVDIINRDPPFENMVRLEDTSLWYYQRYFERDALVDYMFAVDDPGTPLAQEINLMGRVEQFWQRDSRNAMSIRSNQVQTSVLQMPRARPFPNWQAMPAVPRGRVYRHRFSSKQLDFSNRSLWVYTPPGYEPDDGREYRLLLLMDGQWAMNTLQVPYIADCADQARAEAADHYCHARQRGAIAALGGICRQRQALRHDCR